jgi:hypothetical protein
MAPKASSKGRRSEEPTGYRGSSTTNTIQKVTILRRDTYDVKTGKPLEINDIIKAVRKMGLHGLGQNKIRCIQFKNRYEGEMLISFYPNCKIKVEVLEQALKGEVYEAEDFIVKKVVRKRSITIFNIPIEVPDEDVADAFRKYGTVIDVRRGYHKEAPRIENGIRTVVMKGEDKGIPRYVYVLGNRFVAIEIMEHRKRWGDMRTEEWEGEATLMKQKQQKKKIKQRKQKKKGRNRDRGKSWMETDEETGDSEEDGEINKKEGERLNIETFLQASEELKSMEEEVVKFTVERDDVHVGAQILSEPSNLTSAEKDSINSTNKRKKKLRRKKKCKELQQKKGRKGDGGKFWMETDEETDDSEEDGEKPHQFLCLSGAVSRLPSARFSLRPEVGPLNNY